MGQRRSDSASGASTGPDVTVRSVATPDVGSSEPQARPAGFLPALRQLWRHRYFRRLMAIRVATQTSDGVLQIALASYVLFSPERQPDAASVAAVLAVTLLPFSLIGPFVSVVLDRWSRRQVILVVDTSRAVLALALAALVATGLRTGPV